MSKGSDITRAEIVRNILFRVLLFTDMRAMISYSWRGEVAGRHCLSCIDTACVVEAKSNDRFRRWCHADRSRYTRDETILKFFILMLQAIDAKLCLEGKSDSPLAGMKAHVPDLCRVPILSRDDTLTSSLTCSRFHLAF